MSWARVGIFLSEAARERKRLRSVAETLGLPVLGSNTIRTLRALKPHATTAFILGTGASAAELSDQELEYIQSQFSIGVNQWILHPLIPDVYAYEVDPDVRLLQALDRPEVRDKAPHLLFLKPSRPEDLANVSHIPEFMLKRSFLYSRVNMWTRKSANIADDFNAISCLSSLQMNSDVLLDNGASVARLIALCQLFDYREIVLVGVDLHSTEYFWHRDPALLDGVDLKDPITNQSGALHETLQATNRPFPIDTYVGRVLPKFLARGRTLVVESKSSLLANSIPVFDWDDIFPSCHD